MMKKLYYFANVLLLVWCLFGCAVSGGESSASSLNTTEESAGIETIETTESESPTDLDEEVVPITFSEPDPTAETNPEEWLERYMNTGGDDVSLKLSQLLDVLDDYFEYRAQQVFGGSLKDPEGFIIGEGVKADAVLRRDYWRIVAKSWGCDHFKSVSVPYRIRAIRVLYPRIYQVDIVRDCIIDYKLGLSQLVGNCSIFIEEFDGVLHIVGDLSGEMSSIREYMKNTGYTDETDDTEEDPNDLSASVLRQRTSFLSESKDGLSVNMRDVQDALDLYVTPEVGVYRLVSFEVEEPFVYTARIGLYQRVKNERFIQIWEHIITLKGENKENLIITDDRIGQPMQF